MWRVLNLEGKKIGRRGKKKKVENVLCCGLNFKVGEFLNSRRHPSLQSEAHYSCFKWSYFLGFGEGVGGLRFNLCHQ